ncbi:phosphoglycerate mutase-like protein [Ascobolus immersus RN42]|uniref:3-phytase n=1 Tax=Ascobolus immersus RN42 TaxID=1160509 RepID=A0A3N4HXT7_ASCIM|nr:phosphoglycerate mutase-like protein [Ascobolus immersus RN42]
MSVVITQSSHCQSEGQHGREIFQYKTCPILTRSPPKHFAQIPIMATFVPRPPYSPEELEKLYPKNLQLEQIQVIFRHGERTPINARFMNTDLPPFWNFCKAAKQFKAAVLESPTDIWSHLSYHRGIETIGPNGVAVMTSSRDGDEEGICLFGELTDTGRQTTLALGQRLRHLYVDQLQFLDKELKDGRPFYLRSSPVPRAQESLHQVFTGLYPPSTRTNLTIAPIIRTRNAADENLYPNENNCRRLLQLARAFADLAAQTWNKTPEMAYIDSKIGKWLSVPAAIDGHPRLSGIQDHINSTIAHDKSVHLPDEFYDPKVREYIEMMTVDEWFRGYEQSSEYRRLGVGNLLANIKDRMIEDIVAPEKTKFALMGCHDTTIAAVLATLGAFDKKWPPFTSSIAFEVFRAVDGANKPAVKKWGWDSWFGRKGVNTDGYYVRLRYNDNPVVVKGCKPAGKHLEGDESFCTLEAFKEIVEKVSPPDWRAECRSNLDKSDIPPVELLD